MHTEIWYGLNPFEVREVLQGYFAWKSGRLSSLNPFEVREVLQAIKFPQKCAVIVSIPLKSGRCCKRKYGVIREVLSLNPFEVREVLQDK